MDGIIDYIHELVKPTQLNEFVKKHHFFLNEDNDDYDGYNYGVTAVHQLGNGRRIYYPIFICYTDCYDIDDKFELNRYEYLNDLNLFVRKETLYFENGIGEPEMTFNKAKKFIDSQVQQFYLIAKYKKMNGEIDKINEEFRD